MSCGDIETMLKNPEARQPRQRDLQLRDLSRTPETLRPARCLDAHLTKAERVAKRAAKIKKGDDEIIPIFCKTRDRLDKVQDVLGNLHHTLGDPPQPPECRMRGNPQPRQNIARWRP